jgi:hypothetical protein
MKFLLEDDHPLLWKTKAVVINGREVVGEVCKVYGDKVWLCNKDGWLEVNQSELKEVQGD